MSSWRFTCGLLFTLAIVLTVVLSFDTSETQDTVSQDSVPPPVTSGGKAAPPPIDCPANHSSGQVAVIEPILLISTNDGRLFAVGQKTGSIKWSLQFGSPIVNMYQVDESGIIQTKRIPLNTAFGASGKDLLSSLYLWQSDGDRQKITRSLSSSSSPIISGSRSSSTLVPLLEGPSNIKVNGQSHCTRKKWFELLIAGKKVEIEPLVPGLSHFKEETFLPSPVITVDANSLMKGEVNNPGFGIAIKLFFTTITFVLLAALSVIWNRFGTFRTFSNSSKLSSRILPENIVQVGKITFDTKEILGRGSAGTCVYKGWFEDENHLVAVKRVIRDQIMIADREIDLLRKLQHPNLVRYFATESDATFKYIAIELAQLSLAEYIDMIKIRDNNLRDKDQDKDHFDEISILHETSCGLLHLHSLNVIHRDIKPQNILISSPDSITGKRKVLITDFGVSKVLEHSTTSNNVSISFEPFVTTTRVMKGTDGWIAPEVLKCKLAGGDSQGQSSETSSSSKSSSEMFESVKRSKQIDIFSMGCLFYYVLTRGRHPFGDTLERQSNIVNGKSDLSELDDEDLIGKQSLISSMISNDPNDRPSMSSVLNYPIFWTKSKQLQFLQDVSDRIEKEHNSELIRTLERDRMSVIGWDWSRMLPDVIQRELIGHRSYQTNQISTLIRAIRNKRHHYRELPPEVQDILGPIPDSFLTYFTDRYPRLLFYVYQKFQSVKHENMFHEYYDQDSRWDFTWQPLPAASVSKLMGSSPNVRKSSNSKRRRGGAKKSSNSSSSSNVLDTNNVLTQSTKENVIPPIEVKVENVDNEELILESDSDSGTGEPDSPEIVLKPHGMMHVKSAGVTNVTSWKCTTPSPTHVVHK